MQKVSINRLIDRLREIPDHEFTCDGVYQFLDENPVDADSLTPYLHWSGNCYTRNRVHIDERFEMLVICWEPGQVSRIHNHSDQKCWMTVPIGRLKGQNFDVEEIDESSGYCRLSETEAFELSDCVAAKVELEKPIHQVLNLREFESRAVSLHIYSRPYDRCLSYCRDTDTFKEVRLYYTSIDGQLCEGVTL